MFGDRLLRVSHHALIGMMVVASMIALSAQTVVDPRYVEFNASPDHDEEGSDGTPVVSSYSLSIHTIGSTVPFTTADLGKPAPDANGVIRVDFLPLLSVVPTPGVTFEARVTAVGPGGSNGSTPSNAFSFAGPPCTPSIAPTDRSAGQAALTGSVAVTAGTGCAWTAQSHASWITLTGATAGSGNGSVPYSVSANTQTAQRIGTVTIAGHTFTVTQAAMGCTFSLSPVSRSVGAAGATNSTSVTAPAGCAWTGVSNNPGWLTITNGASGSGSGVVTFNAATNGTTQARTGALTIGGQTFTVNQSAGTCTFSISPLGQTVAAGGAGGSATVTTASTCEWTAASNASWISLTAGATGTGSGPVTFNVSANPGSQRTGTLTIAGRTFTVTQNTCSYSLSPLSRTIPTAGGPGSTFVTTTASCAWQGTSNVSWITVGSSSTGGSGTLTYSVAANPGVATRTGTITVRSRVHTVNQNGSTLPAAPGGFRVVGGSGAQ